MITPITFVGQAGGTASAAGVTLTYTPTVGNLVVVSFCGAIKGTAGLYSSTGVTVSDSASNTWFGGTAGLFGTFVQSAFSSVVVSGQNVPQPTHSAASLMEFSGVRPYQVPLEVLDPADLTNAGSGFLPSITLGGTSTPQALVVVALGWGDGTTGTAATISGQPAEFTLGTVRSLAVGGGTKVNVNTQQAFTVLTARAVGGVSYSGSLSAQAPWIAEGFGVDGFYPPPVTVISQAVTRSAIF